MLSYKYCNLCFVAITFNKYGKTALPRKLITNTPAQRVKYLYLPICSLSDVTVKLIYFPFRWFRSIMQRNKTHVRISSRNKRKKAQTPTWFPLFGRNLNLGMSFQFMHSSVNWNTVQKNKQTNKKLKEKTKGKERVKHKECAL